MFHGNLKVATRQDVIDWISSAWDEVLEDIIRHGFKACCLTLALDGSEYDLLHEQMAVALDAQDRLDNARMEAADFLFDDDSDGDESEFEGFGEEDLEDLEEEASRRVRRGSGGDAVLD